MKLSRKIIFIVSVGLLIATLWSSLLISPLVDQLTQSVDPLLQALVKLTSLLLLIVIPTTIIIWKILISIIVEPINYFNRVSRKIATGNLGEQIRVFSSDELGELGQNINILVKNLAVAFQNMANSLSSELRKEKQLSETLKQVEREKARIEALLTSINDGVIAVDKLGKIILFNKAASRLTGYSSEEVLDMPYLAILKFQKEKDNTPVKDFIRMELTGQPTEGKEPIVIVQKSGQMLPVSTSIGLIIDQDKDTLGAVVVLRDITYQRQLDRMKDEFVSVASHELRTPMTAIKGIISMIFEGDFGRVSPDLKDPLSDVATSTERLIDLVNDMLDVSRIQAGRLKFTVSEAKVIDVIKEVITLLKPLAEQKQIKLTSTYSGLEVIKTDVNKVKQILNNIIGNSLKFTDFGSITVSAIVKDDLINISVADTGLGILAEDQTRLFNKFTQLSSSELGRPRGTGLGLYISREFAKKLGGDLWITSSVPGKGSTFTFSIPLAGSTLAIEVEKQLQQTGSI